MTPRPGRIFTEFVIDAPFPRGDGFRMSPGYAETCRTVAAALSAAMADAA